MTRDLVQNMYEKAKKKKGKGKKGKKGKGMSTTSVCVNWRNIGKKEKKAKVKKWCAAVGTVTHREDCLPELVQEVNFGFSDVGREARSYMYIHLVVV